MVGSAELRKREDENKTKGNWEMGRAGAALSLPFPLSRPANFLRAFYFRVFPTIWEPGTGYLAWNLRPGSDAELFMNPT